MILLPSSIAEIGNEQRRERDFSHLLWDVWASVRFKIKKYERKLHALHNSK